jgi:hypothetical protein
VTPEKEIVWKYVNPVQGGTPFGPPPRPGQIVSPVAGDMLGLSSVQRMQMDEIQKDIDAHLDKLLTADQKKQATESAAGAGGFRPPQLGQVMTVPEQDRLKLTDEQKKDMAALQTAVKSRFDNVLTDAQKKQLKSVLAPFAFAQANPGAGDADGPQPGKILSARQQDTLKLSPEQRKRMAEIQKDIDARLETLLTEDQKKLLQTMRRVPTVARAAPPGGPGRPGGSPVFRAYRYGIDYPGFAGKKLLPGKSLEELQKEVEKKVSASKK